MNGRLLVAAVVVSTLMLANVVSCRMRDIVGSDLPLDKALMASLDESVPELLHTGSDEGITDTTGREIVCWGDSMTEGVGVSEAVIDADDGFFDARNLSYPDVLQRLTGIRTLNFGVSGATSEEIAIMQGALEPNEDMGSYDALNPLVTEAAREHKGDVLVLEIGSNGGWNGNYDTLIAQYDAMIAYAECEGFIVIGDTDDPGTSIGDTYQQRADYLGTDDTAWEAALRAAYGDKFLNMRVFLIENGLEIAGFEASPDDEEAAAQGCISTQLRADWTHLNSYGYYAKAVAVYQQGRQLGYWD